MHTSPLALMEALLEARSRADLVAVVACYESTATIAVAADTVLSGPEVIRGFSEAVSAMDISFSDRRILEGDGIAIHYAAWKRQEIVNGASTLVEGVTTDVLRRQPDGTWLLCIDNPWGTKLSAH